jgi:predicted PurR-regulated permease PerM
MTVKEKYWRYSLVAIILGLGVVLLIEFIPFMSGILGALTAYIIVRKQMIHWIRKKQWKRNWAAIAAMVEVVLCFLIPISLFVWLVVNKIQNISFDPHQILAAVNHLSDLVYQKSGYRLLKEDDLENILSISSNLPVICEKIMSSTSSFVMNIFVLLFVLYFMLVNGKEMEKYIIEILPFNDVNKKEMLHKVRVLVTSNAIGIPLLAIIQGGIAYVGYIIFGTPSPFLFGLLTCFATIIPIVGTALIWLPLAIYLALTDDWGSAIGLVAYGVIVVTNIDNLVRFILQKKMADTHPLITVFGVIIGISLFGFMGVIFGPILLSMFFLCLNMFKKEYLS